MNLGDKVRDKLNGFEGVIVGRAEYLYDVPRALVDPSCMKDGKPGEGQWIPEARLEVNDAKPATGFRSPKYSMIYRHEIQKNTD